MKDDGSSTGSGHPINVAVCEMRRAAASVAEQPTWSLDAADTRAALVDLQSLQAQTAELEARLMTHADAVEAGVSTGATSTATWLAHATRLTRPAASRKAHLAKALGTHEATREALGRGDLHVDQASVITASVDALPDEVVVREQCEKHLIALAEHHDAKELKILGRRILEVIDPDLADAHEAEQLAKEEAKAENATSVAMHDDGHGQVHGRFTLPASTGAMLRSILMGFAAPKHVRATEGAGSFDVERPTPQKMGRAFKEMIERYPTDLLPHTGGVTATVVITIPVETLLGGIKAASLDTGDKITASEARRIACEAGLIPAVLDGHSQVLDLGRQQRFHTKAQRIAVGLEQRHCQHPSCTTPAVGCHVHHTEPWSTGGKTDIKTAKLLCPRHHSLAHRDPPMRN
ncbi:MAG: DUF222 domain-containing protein [Nocardioides sp.]